MSLFAFTDEFERTLERWDGSIGAPSQENRKINRIRVYKNGFVENVLASSHWTLPGLWFGWAVIYGIYLLVSNPSAWLSSSILFVAGVLTFTLVEYLIHRFAFHFDPGQDPKKRLKLFLMHGLHHQFPNDRLRLVAPPLMSWPLGLALFGIYWLLLPLDQAFVLFGGTCLGYLFYDWTHYYTHHCRSPKTSIGKALRRSHAVHHYKLFHLNMGISSPLWDYLFGSYAWSEEAMRAAMKETREVEALSGDESPATLKSGGSEATGARSGRSEPPSVPLAPL